MSTETNNTINYLNTLIRRESNSITIELYRKPTETGMVIHLTSNHPLGQKISVFLILHKSACNTTNNWKFKTERAGNSTRCSEKQWLSTQHDTWPENKATKQEKIQKQQETLTPQNKWVTFTYFSPLIRRITNLFRHTRLKIAFCATNTIQQQLTTKQTHDDPSGIYRMRCKTCNKVYVGQSGRTIGIRFKEHIRYIRSNNSTSAYATHVLESRHEYGTRENMLHLLKACRKGRHLDCWRALYIQVFCHKKVLIDEQEVSDTNPLFELSNIPYTPWLESYPFQHTSPRTHTKQYWYWFYKNYSVVKTISFLPSMIINYNFQKFIYIYAAALPQITSTILKNL